MPASDQVLNLFKPSYEMPEEEGDMNRLKKTCNSLIIVGLIFIENEQKMYNEYLLWFYCY